MTATPSTGTLGVAAADRRRGTVRGSGGRVWPIAGAEEIFRFLYSSLETGTGTSVAVCSATTGEGKTTLSLGLAIAIAQDLPDRRVVVIETDLWRPVLASDFGIAVSPGLVDCLLDRQPLASAIRATTLDNLSLLPAGTVIGSPQRLLRSRRMPEIIDAVRRTYDVVIVDTPAILAHSEVAVLAKMVEEVVFVVRVGVTQARDVGSALGRLQGSNLRGMVLNDTHSSIPSPIRRLVRL